MTGKGVRRREKNYRAAHGGDARLPPPPKQRELDALPSKLRRLIAIQNKQTGGGKAGAGADASTGEITFSLAVELQLRYPGNRVPPLTVVVGGGCRGGTPGKQDADVTGKNKEGKDKVMRHRNRVLLHCVEFDRNQFVSCVPCSLDSQRYHSSCYFLRYLVYQ
jgi:hypothetical protein